MLNVVVLMAGRGSRFAGARHQVPKPLIEVVPGRRMIDLVVGYLAPREPHHFVFVCLEPHVRRFALRRYLGALTRRPTIVTTRRVTRGPACSALLAAGGLDPDDEVLVAYCDDYLDVRIDNVLARWRARGADGGLLLYPSTLASDSYALADRHGNVRRVAEKIRISRRATAGLYYFRRAGGLVHGARRMIRAGRRAHGEFFVSTIYNELIRDGRTVVAAAIPASANHGMGTPEELARFVARKAWRHRAGEVHSADRPTSSRTRAP